MNSHPSPITIETLDQNPSLLISGNTHQLGLILANQFLSKSIPTFLYHSTPPNLEFANQFKLNNLAALRTTSKLEPINPSPHYCCYISAPDENTSQTIKHLHQILTTIPTITKLSLILFDPLPKTTSKLQQQTHSFPQTSIRLVAVHHLFGPGVDPHQSYQINHLLQTNPDSLSPSQQTQTLYPTYSFDLGPAIYKITLTHQPLNHPYRLAGNPVSVINLLLQTLPAHPLFTNHPQTHPPQSLDDELLQQQIHHTQTSLGTIAKTDLDQAISTTISWLNQLSPPTQPSRANKPNPVQKPPEPALTTIHDLKPHDTPANPLPEPNPPPSSKPPKHFSLFNKSISPTQQELETHITPITSPAKPKKRFLKPKSTSILLLLAVSFIFALIAGSLLNLFLLFSSLNQLHVSIAQAKLESVPQKVNRIKTHLQIAKLQTRTLSPAISLFNSQAATNLQSLTQLMDNSTNLAKDFSRFSHDSTKLLSAITDRQPDNIPLLLTSTRTDLTKIYHGISELEADINNQPQLVQLTIFDIGPTLSRYLKQINTIKPMLAQSIELLANTDSLLGFNQPKTYLVLLQNSAELRPTGGFIGSYALITFDKGKLHDFSVEDVYVADGQLKGHVEPPQAIKKYLGEAGWYLRDVNWDPHFPSTAKRAIWFLDKEMGIQPDGVVGINLHLVKNLVSAHGQIELPDYDLTITAENLFDQIESHVELNQFPGSTQKADILGSLSRILIEKTLNASPQTISQLTKHVFDSLNRSQTQVYFSDSKLQNLVASFNWAGDIEPKGCPQTKSKTCLADYMYLVEANVGINKANYFVTRKIDHQVTIAPNRQISHQFNLTLHNSSTTNVWPGGVYKNYLRLYLPQGALLQQVLVNNNRLSLNQIDSSIEHSSQVFGFLVNTNPTQTTDIVVTYRLSKPLSSDSPVAYHFTQYKQPGTPDDPFTFTFTPPPNHEIVVQNPTPSTSSPPHQFSTTLDQSRNFLFELAR